MKHSAIGLSTSVPGLTAAGAEAQYFLAYLVGLADAVSAVRAGQMEGTHELSVGVGALGPRLEELVSFPRRRGVDPAARPGVRKDP